MWLLRGLGVVAVLAAAPAFAGAADLTKVDRAIGREPPYRSKAPRYGLLLFGPRAEMRVWLVLDGDTLYLDRNGDGNLTDEGDRVPCSKSEGARAHARRWFDAGDLTAPGGGAKFPRLVVSVQRLAVGGQEDAHHCRVWVEALACQHGAALLAARRQDAPVLHFGGPLAMLMARDEQLILGQECEVGASVGTAGSGVTHREGAAVVTTLFCQPFKGPGGIPTISRRSIPDGVHPVAEIEFPAKDPGGAALKARVVLARRC